VKTTHKAITVSLALSAPFCLGRHESKKTTLLSERATGAGARLQLASVASSEASICTFTARTGLDISASQWNTSPIYGKVRIDVRLKSLSVELIAESLQA
jgi:hypothetical protein